MEKQKRWQFALIIAVIVLTLYNVLPTVFYYTKPLRSPIDEVRAEKVALQIIDRVNDLEKDSKAWLYAFGSQLGVKPTSVELKEDDPGTFLVTFKDVHSANLFKKFLPNAGDRIPFVPAQLDLDPAYSSEDSEVVAVSRQINVHLDPNEVNQLFHFFPREVDGVVSETYRQNVYDRVTELALAFGGPSQQGIQLAAIASNSSDPSYDDLAIRVAKDIVELDSTFESNSPILKRSFANFTQVDGAGTDLVSKLQSRLGQIQTRLTSQIDPLLSEQKRLETEGRYLESNKLQRLRNLQAQLQSLELANQIVRSNAPKFQAGQKPLTANQVASAIKSSEAKVDPKEQIQVVSLQGRHPYVEALVIDWSNDKIDLKFFDDVEKIRFDEGKSESAAYRKEKVNQFLINAIARASQSADETIAPDGDGFAIALGDLTGTQSFLSFDLGYLAKKQVTQIQNAVAAGWNPNHADLVSKNYPIVNFEDFQKLSPTAKKLGLVVYAPAMDQGEPMKGFRSNSIYVIARGLDRIIQKYSDAPDAPGADQLREDFGNLNRILKSYGFIGYPASSANLSGEFEKDFIFELDDYYSTLLNATREDFYVKGSKRSAILDFTDVEQRIITQNRIEDQQQEDLIKWKEEYDSAQVDLNPARKYEVPPPTKNIYWENTKLSAAKYFRGDDRKILKWGLDLSGGKTVRIGLRDHNNRTVTDPNNLNQAVNELYKRVNSMGVAERTIRIENDNIILDFPGSQALTAQELVKASAMYFHIVNEQFSPANPLLRDSVNQFLQDVWNEAVVTNRKDSESINQIAWEHLGGDIRSGSEYRPRTDAAKTLYENGLRLANPKETPKSHAYDDTLSAIAKLRGDDFSEWEGQSHPLMIVFHNYALEGANLTNVQVGYDPSQGNILSFGVKRSYDNASYGSPSEDFFAWTSQFAEDRIVGTPKEAYSQGRGWRMAVVLNEEVVTHPSLRAALRDGGTISGRFSQREVSQLAADLKAGSLSFTPKILSEQNVSPELGLEERVHGITASIVGLFLVAAVMITYYRFAGLVATCAVLFNLLIMWGVLQNLGAALTLPGIAGIVLTIGMAVDANVLVFERVREEFAKSGRIASAIQAGYSKAFSAIIDSNITTIIAALILIQFDSGPIKGFAVTIIIGLISSMFTALFMTRYYFAGWVKNPKNNSLTLSNWIGETNYDFLGKAKAAVIISVIVIVAGSFLFYNQRNTLFGMDFTGGYSLHVEVEEQPDNPEYRLIAIKALEEAGASINDFEIRELSHPTQLRIQLGIGMEESGHPYYGMPESTEEGKFAYEYQKNPRINWVIEALAEKNLNVQQSDLPTLEKDWTMMSGQFSEAMRDNAIKALGLALLSILVYITFRFEFKYAIGAVIALAHDVMITMGILAFLHWIGLPVQIDLEVVGAIMTIIGYSLNDTIIVFDRIREDLTLMRKMEFSDIINHAINVTLSRTVLTSGTTVLVLLSLVFLGGRSIFDFSLVMTIGVLVGTFSSLFVAGPVLLFFHNREQKAVAVNAG